MAYQVMQAHNALTAQEEGIPDQLKEKSRRLITQPERQ